MSQAGRVIISSNAGGDLKTLTGNFGGAVGPDASGNINVIGASPGINITGDAFSNTITVTALGTGIVWHDITSTSVTADFNSGYTANNSGLVTVTLPNTEGYGTVIWVVGKGSGGWKIAQNAGQSILYAGRSTTPGTGGALESTSDNDAVQLLCTNANVNWTVITAVGTITIV